MEKTTLPCIVMVTLFIIGGRENKHITYRQTNKEKNEITLVENNGSKKIQQHLLSNRREKTVNLEF